MSLRFHTSAVKQSGRPEGYHPGTFDLIPAKSKWLSRVFSGHRVASPQGTFEIWQNALVTEHKKEESALADALPVVC
ncbi:MAG: hypothetical protein EBY29_10980 [Planctomycetes bacterium]|nr:hypothetical protein [Planctomycetota bacterium]